MVYFVGIDFGTSGARLNVIDDSLQVCFENLIGFQSWRDRADSGIWTQVLFLLLNSIPRRFKTQIRRIAIDGTSATVLLCDEMGIPLASPKLYNQSCNAGVVERLKAVAPPGHVVLSSTSSLAKLLSWKDQAYFVQARFLLHQADWLAAQLHGQFGLSDYHNSLKLGFDPQYLVYPDWVESVLTDMSLLPNPLCPGTLAARIQPQIAQQLGLPMDVEICAGTTDSIAAFLASGAHQIGEAVTSLGSTIALKLLSDTRVDSSLYGVYSHWFDGKWLVGGASNSGGAVLSHFFSDADLAHLSEKIDWSNQHFPVYVPLLSPGERFPINNPMLQPCFEPRAEDPVEFLQALLVSLTQVEVEGYQKLKALGASSLTRIYTAGGGAKNLGWMQWRRKTLGVPVLRSPQPEAAYGAAKLAAGVLTQCSLGYARELL